MPRNSFFPDEDVDLPLDLGHVRLSIVDLSPRANQPFHDAANDVHAVVNGELYNDGYYRELLGDEYDFQSQSDCEIVLALYQHYGLSFLSHLRGEFALILWDARREVFIGARDRYGVKSLYYTVVDNQLLVATEMKCFLPFGWKPEWDVQGLKEGNWPFGYGTVFKGVNSVSCLSLDLGVFLTNARLPQVTISPAETSVLFGIVSTGTLSIQTR